MVDAGAGTAAHYSSNNQPCVTISLDIKFIGISKLNDVILGSVTIEKKTRSLVFLNCKLKCKNKIIATASGIWKIVKYKISGAGFGG